MTPRSTKSPPGGKTVTLRLPRVHLAPDRVATAGPEACELAASYGLVAQPWQELVLDDMLGERIVGGARKWAARNAGLSVPRQNGKSVIAIIRLLAGLYLFDERLIVYTAHQVGTAKETFRALVDLIEHNKDLKRRLKRVSYARGDEAIELTGPTQRLIVKARSKEAVRGFSADLILLDEAQMGLDELDMAALGPTQRARTNPQTVFMGTPPLEAGTYWGRVRKRALGGEARMSWHEWSPPKGFDPLDPEVWEATNPSIPALISVEDVQNDIHSLGSRFSCEALGAWPAEREDAGWDVIGAAEWEAAQDPASEIAGRPCFAVEVDPSQHECSIGVAGRTKAGLRHLEIAARFPADPGRIVGWLIKRIAQWDPVAIVIDPSGPAGFLISDVERHCRIEVKKPQSREVAAACGSVYVGLCGDSVSARDVRVRPHPALDAAAKAAVWRARGDARVFDRRKAEDADPAPLMAVVLADYGHSNPGSRAAKPWIAFG